MRKNRIVTKVALALLFLIVAAGLPLYAQAGDKQVGNEILSAQKSGIPVQKGGVPDKVYTQKKPRISVAAYNIGKNQTADDVSDLSTLNKAVKKINADIIAITEVDNKTARSKQIDQLHTIAESNGLYYAFGKALDYDGGEYGLGILSKYAISRYQVLNLPSGDAEQRVVLLAEISCPGFDSPVIMMVTHLDWHKDPTIRLAQVRHILDVSIGDTASNFKDIASSIKILAGDFNSTRNEQPVQELGFFWNMADKRGTDLRSWPAANPAIDIDHIFTFKGQQWKVKKLTVPHDDKDFIWSAASDHLPVIADLELLEQ